jgi:hypothetical protein
MIRVAITPAEPARRELSLVIPRGPVQVDALAPELSRRAKTEGVRVGRPPTLAEPAAGLGEPPPARLTKRQRADRTQLQGQPLDHSAAVENGGCVEKGITIADWLIILVTFLGPITAVQLQKFIEAQTSKKHQKLRIFHTLMATRAMRATSIEHVQALNSIEVFFNDKGNDDRAVRDSWRIYLDFLLQRVPQKQTEAEAGAYNDKGVDLLVNLLEAIGSSLNYDFDKVQLKRGGYYPQLHFDELSAISEIRKGVVSVLRGQSAIPMNVVGFPVSEDALAQQREVQQALLPCQAKRRLKLRKISGIAGKRGCHPHPLPHRVSTRPVFFG